MDQLAGGNTDGATPLTFEEQEGLIPVVLTRGELDVLEAANISDAIDWLAGRPIPPQRVLDETFLRELHRRMFGRVWRWAGAYRRSDKNIGVPWPTIGVELRVALDDARFQIDDGMDADEIAIRLGHRVVAVHPFVNGNGRHSRLLSDLLAEALGRESFGWGPPGDPSHRRALYLAALRQADGGDPSALIAFARS